MTLLYFAYGSNMLPSRLLARCPSARPVGLASAPGHMLDFSKPSLDGSGKATLRAAAGAWTPGVLFALDGCDLPALDKSEGVADGGYRRLDSFPVVKASGEEQAAATYIAGRRDAALRPYDWYLAAVIAGVVYHELSAEHLDQLRAVASISDPTLTRPARIHTLAALQADGYDDYRALLSA